MSEQASQVFIKPDTRLLPLDIIVTDPQAKGVLCLTREGQVQWSYGYQKDQNLQRPVCARQYDDKILVTDARLNQVLVLSKTDQSILYCLDKSGDTPFKMPQSALLLNNGHILVTDLLNRRLVEMTLTGEEIWSFRDETLLVSPQYAEALDNGDILFTDDVYNRVVQLNREGEVVWFYGSPLPGEMTSKLLTPQFATRLPNGNTLIADTRHHRVLEVNSKGDIIWQFTGRARFNQLNPTWAQRLENGHTLIMFSKQHLILELDGDNQVIWSYTKGEDPFAAPFTFAIKEQMPIPETLQHNYPPALKETLLAYQSAGKKIVEYHINLMQGCQMKSLRASVIMMEIEKKATIHTSFPSAEELMAERFDQNFIMVVELPSDMSPEDLQASLVNIGEVDAVEIEALHLENGA